MLQSIERLKFTDGSLALDFDGHAGQVVKMLGAVFGKAAIVNKQWVGIALSLLDNGVSYEQLGASVMQYLGKTNHADIVAQLWNNLTGTMPTAQQAAPIVQFLQDGMGVGTLCALAADTSVNATNIGLIGLADTGIAFL